MYPEARGQGVTGPMSLRRRFGAVTHPTGFLTLPSLLWASLGMLHSMYPSLLQSHSHERLCFRNYPLCPLVHRKKGECVLSTLSHKPKSPAPGQHGHHQRIHRLLPLDTPVFPSDHKGICEMVSTERKASWLVTAHQEHSP